MDILPGDICTSGFPELSAQRMFAWKTNGYSRLLLARLEGGPEMTAVSMQSAQRGMPAALSFRTGSPTKAALQ
jgi:hypothetical protein